MQLIDVFFSQGHRHTRKKKIRVLPTGVEIISSDALRLSYRRLVRAIRPLKEAHVTNIPRADKN